MTPTQDIEHALHRVSLAMGAGNYVLADFIVQRLLKSVPEHPVALNFGGIIAAKIGLHDSAITYFERALKTAPQFHAARENIEAAKTLAPAATPKGRRYLLIKSWGFGFWADVTHVLACLLLAEMTGRVPITNWGSGSRFSDGSGPDAFQFYFERISEFTADMLPKFGPGDVFPERAIARDLKHEDWTKLKDRGPGGILFLARPEHLVVSDFYAGVVDLLPWLPEHHPLFGKSIGEVYRYLAEKYLKPVAGVNTAVEEFRLKHLVGRRTVAAHARGSDKRLEFPTLDRDIERYFVLLDAEPASSQIFVLTEDRTLLSRFRDRYGARVIFTECQRTENSTGPHYVESTDKVRLGREVMVDVYLALHCSKFIGHGSSNVSAVVDLLRDWRGQSTLIAPSQLLESNLSLAGG